MCLSAMQSFDADNDNKQNGGQHQHTVSYAIYTICIVYCSDTHLLEIKEGLPCVCDCRTLDLE